MKIALTLVAVAAAGMFAGADRQLPTPSQIPAPAKIPEFDFSTPRLPGVAPIELPPPVDSSDDLVGAGSCGCGGASSADAQGADDEWDIVGCSTGTDDEDVDIPSGTIDRVR